MAETASTLEQVILLILFVLPGISYQFMRERMRGRVPGERDLGERVLRALTASIALDAIYVIAAGPSLVHLIRLPGHPWFSVTAAEPRQAAAVALGLFFVVPTGAAWLVGLAERRRYPSRFDVTPTAWHHAFRGKGTGFIRARLKSGAWVGGWYGRSSYASSYPDAPDLYLESAYEMNRDGTFGARIQETSGLYLRGDNIEVLEFLDGDAAAPAAGVADSEKGEEAHA